MAISAYMSLSDNQCSSVLTFRHCGRGSFRGRDAYLGRGCFFLFSALEIFSPGTLVFPGSPQKPTFDLIWFFLIGFDLLSTDGHWVPRNHFHIWKPSQSWDSSKIATISNANFHNKNKRSKSLSIEGGPLIRSVLVPGDISFVTFIKHLSLSLWLS